VPRRCARSTCLEPGRLAPRSKRTGPQPAARRHLARRGRGQPAPARRSRPDEAWAGRPEGVTGDSLPSRIQSVDWLGRPESVSNSAAGRAPGSDTGLPPGIAWHSQALRARRSGSSPVGSSRSSQRRADQRHDRRRHRRRSARPSGARFGPLSERCSLSSRRLGAAPGRKELPGAAEQAVMEAGKPKVESEVNRWALS
jgi:hypothetical protein